ncbi:MAG: ferrous iron transport protein A [Methylococcaceae bacterium]|nr:ferrous iron transport protein A [Methylococcaceae bacterium]MCI0666783.1 ferrous iron transport protein A [Methylococcaceae bacterium]MCI0733256.1 ferrous iron transport protein A [Methylococcaceae bacterium]
MSDSIQNMKAGESGRIVGFGTAAKSYRKKLLAMGLTPGAEFHVTRFAPMGDPVEIKIRGFSLSLRKEEAAGLLIERI